jgi:uncharacterized membrane protein
MYRILRGIALFLAVTSIILFAVGMTIVQFANPELTRTQIALKIGWWLIPLVITWLLVIVVEQFAPKAKKHE